MVLVVTGGGTGGHVYPALEVAEAARTRGWEIAYLGSLRGQEGALCRAHGVDFFGFDSHPLYSLRSYRGWRSLFLLLKATRDAKSLLSKRRPSVIFSSGGYSAAPIMAAARSLSLPYVVHESNSIPGRSNRLFAARASRITCTFKKTLEIFRTAVRTGQPIRKELRVAALSRCESDPPLVLGVGGSQGSEFLNRALPAASKALGRHVEVLLAAGRSNYERVIREAHGAPDLKIVPYLETDALTEAYQRTSVAVGRSGGTLAEFALFRVPSVLIPYPSAADNHQLRNAQEFEAMGAAIIVDQQRAKPDDLAAGIGQWLESPERRKAAAAALAEWSIPDATERIVGIVEQAAGISK